MILTAIRNALSQMGDPAFRRVLVWTLSLTLLLFIGLGYATSFAVAQIPVLEPGWLNIIIDLAAGLGFLFVVWFLFPGAATAVMGLFLDDAAEAVENRYYPMDPPGTPLGMMAAFWEAVKLGLVILLVNVAALPIYALALFFPPLAVILYYGLNSYLLGREYFEMVALRHGPPAHGKAMRRQFSGTVTLAGFAIALAFSIPVVNLLAPLFAVAVMVHIYKALMGREVQPVAGGIV